MSIMQFLLSYHSNDAVTLAGIYYKVHHDNTKIREVIYQTRETVFHWDIQTPRRVFANTTRSGVFLMKFEVFG